MDTDGALQSDASRNLILAEIALSLSVIADIALIAQESNCGEQNEHDT